MASLRIYLFGVPRFERDGESVSLTRRKSIALLAYLAVSAQAHSRDSLATMLWPENDQSSARTNLRREIFRVKNAIGEDFLVIEREQIALDSQSDIWLDTQEFQAQIAGTQQHDHGADLPCEECLKAFKQAMDLYTDDFMAGFSLPDSVTFDEWQFFQGETLRSSLAETLQSLIRGLSKRGDYEEGIEYARRWLALDRLHEPAHRQLMWLYARSGQQSAALRQYQECVRLLMEELGIEPEEETIDLYEAIKTKQITAADTGISQNVEPVKVQKASPLPEGTVTLLYTDIEGSTPLWESDPHAMERALKQHNRIIQAAIADHEGQVFKFVGDSFQAAFVEPSSAVQAAIAAQHSLTKVDWGIRGEIRVRMGIHTGVVEAIDDDYVPSHTFNRVARITSAGHGGQILLSLASAELIHHQLPEGVAVRDLGEHRLKGLSRPERIFQVIAPGLQQDFPPLITRSIQILNMPTESTPFVGREDELAQLEEMLANPDARLVTIVGLGGTGKTQLAMNLARKIAHKRPDLFANGIVFVPLAGVDTLDGFPTAVAKALQISLAGQVEAIIEIGNYLYDQETLLILDNFEQIIDGVDLVNQVLNAAPGIKVLVTSREPLHLASEWRFDLWGLSYPKGPLSKESWLRSNTDLNSPENGRYESVELFLQTAQQIGADFELTAETAPYVGRLCQMVAGVPLAIKLAATWLRVMPCDQIVSEISRNMDILTSRMRDTPARQRSMRAVFEQTWELLRPDERTAFQALSIFRGGFTEDAASEVADVSPFLLVGLLDRRLVQRSGESRYEVHELTRQFAAEKLNSTDLRPEIADRHSAYYLKRVADQEASLHSEAPARAIDALEAEIDNIHQAWKWALENKQTTLIHAALDSLAAFYEFAGLIAEGEKAFGKAAEALAAEPPDVETNELLCNLLVKHLFLALIRGVNPEIDAKTDKAAELARELDHEERLADVHLIRGFTYELRGEYDEALQQYKQSQSLYERLGRQREFATVLNQIGETLVFMSQPSKAEVYHLQALRIGFSLKDMRLRALSLSYLGVTYYYLDDLSQAANYWEQAIALFEEIGNLLGLGRTLNNLAYVHNIMGNHQQALKHVTRSLEVLQQIEVPHSEAAAFDTIGRIYFALGDYAEARNCYAKALERVQESGLLRQYEAGFLTSIGLLDMAEGHYEKAEKQFKQALETVIDLEPPKEIAATLGALADLYLQTDRLEEALEHYDQAITTLRQVDEKSEMAPLMVRKATALLERGELDQAEGLVNEGLNIAHNARRRSTIFKAQLLGARLAHIRGRTADAKRQLDALLSEFTEPPDQAEANYEGWKMEGDRTYAEQALKLYQSLAARTPNVVYRQRRDELQAALAE